MYESKLICRSTLKSETSQPPTPTVSRVGRTGGTELEVGRSVLEQCGARVEQLKVQASELDGEAAHTVEVINARADKLVESVRKSSEALSQTVWSHKEVLRKKLMSKELSTRQLHMDLPNLTQEQQLQEWEKLDREEVNSSFLLTPADTFGGIGKLLMGPEDMAKEYIKEAQDAGQKGETDKRWCHLCKKKVNGSTMRRHMAEKHKIGKNEFPCPNCRKVFTRDEALRAHQCKQ